MGFQIIKAETRVANMITWFAGIQKKITDFVVGGKTRTKFEAVAVEMEAQDLQFYIVAKKAIATGIYQSFNFQLLPAARATGSVTFTASPAPSTPITIPAGTRIATVATSATPEKVYQTMADAIIGAGQTTASAQISALTAGTVGNTGLGTITSMKTTLSGISSVTNPAALTNGAEKETEIARRLRFQEYISVLTRGTGSALVYGAKTTALTDIDGNITEQVTSAVVTGPPETGSAGICSIYIFNGVDGASAELIAAAQGVIDGDYETNTPGYKAAGIVATVYAATTIAVDVTMTIAALDGYDGSALEDAALAIIDQYLSSFDIGETCIINEIVERVMSIDGVYNLSMAAPSADVTTTQSQVIVPGTVSVTVS